VRAILDSGPLIALWRPREEHKRWAEQLFRRFTGPFYVSELVLSEVSHLTGRDRDILAGLKAARFILGADIVEDLPSLERCCSKYPHCDLADASVIAMSERRPTLQVLTLDRKHFVAYRRADGSPLPLTMPEPR
jgi:predicted nucleic acid-binding protein